MHATKFMINISQSSYDRKLSKIVFAMYNIRKDYDNVNYK